MNRLYLLRKLRSFGVQGDLLTSFYDSVVASAIFYGVVCWSSSISAVDRMRLIKKASSILGCPLDSVQVVGESRMMDKLSSLLMQDSHPLQVTISALGSSFNRLIHPQCVKERDRRSVLPAAVRLEDFKTELKMEFTTFKEENKKEFKDELEDFKKDINQQLTEATTAASCRNNENHRDRTENRRA